MQANQIFRVLIQLKLLRSQMSNFGQKDVPKTNQVCKFDAVLSSVINGQESEICTNLYPSVSNEIL